MRLSKMHSLFILIFSLFFSGGIAAQEFNAYDAGNFEDFEFLEGADEGYGGEECMCGGYCYTPLNRHQVYIGPEIYHVRRTRHGGTEQTGTMYGVRIGYDRIKRCRIYWGGDFLYARGTLNGKSGRGSHLKSHLTDESIEGRIGYTFQKKCGIQVSFTPYIGVGYLRETNRFVSPSPIPVHFNTRFAYGAAGFLSNVPINERFEIGLNFKLKWMIDPQCKVTNDPDQDNFTQNIKQELQYRVDLPITYNFQCYQRFALCLTPFYEYRHYGTHLNFPIDFMNTKFRNYGGVLEIIYRL